MEKVESAARKGIAAVADGDMLRTQLAILRRLAKYEPFNTIELRQQVALFFSSRRRHTIFDCDWSSDVCSSDLALFAKNLTNIGRKIDLSWWLSHLWKEEALSKELGANGDGYVPRSKKMSTAEAVV